MTEVVMPSGGMAMTEGVIVQWLKAPGDVVAEGDPILEIETDKAVEVVQSPASGTLGPHRYAQGEVVSVGEVLALILGPGEELPVGDCRPVGKTASAHGTVGLPEPQQSSDPANEGVRHHLSPRARREAEAEAEPGRRDYRAIIAAKVSESWRTMPHFAVIREIKAEQLLADHERLREQVGSQLTLTDLLLRALARAVRAGKGSTAVDIGMAVATPAGVMIAVIRDVLGKDWQALVQARRAARERALAREMTPQDLEDLPAITLSNLGAFKVDAFTGIIPLGQRAIMTIGSIGPRVIAEGGVPAVRSTLIATLNVDHRFYDGVDAARLLDQFAAELSGVTQTADGSKGNGAGL